MANQPKDSKKGKSYAGRHQEIYDKRCPVCTHKQRQLLEEAYLRWDSAADLSDPFGITHQAITAHCETLGLHVERMSNYKAFYAKMVSRGMEELNTADLTPKLILALMKHYDALEGRVIHRVEQQKYGTVQVVGMAAPGGTLPPKPKQAALPAAEEPIEADFAPGEEISGGES